MKGTGPRRDFILEAFAGWLADLWLECSDAGIAPRDSDKRDWPFLHFVEEVGRSLDPEFTAYRAVRRAYERKRKHGMTTAKVRRSRRQV